MPKRLVTEDERRREERAGEPESESLGFLS